jgi:hypothetical protein
MWSRLFTQRRGAKALHVSVSHPHAGVACMPTCQQRMVRCWLPTNPPVLTALPANPTSHPSVACSPQGQHVFSVGGQEHANATGDAFNRSKNPHLGQNRDSRMKRNLVPTRACKSDKIKDIRRRSYKISEDTAAPSGLGSPAAGHLLAQPGSQPITHVIRPPGATVAPNNNKTQQMTK